METNNPVWLEIDRKDFLDALKRLKPGRMLKSFLTKELQIGFLKNEAVFCIEGAQTRRPAKGQWNGFVCLPYGLLLPYLKVKPDTAVIRLTYLGGRLSLGVSRYKAKWIDVSPWIGQMALEAHFMGPADEPAPKRFCPQCGKPEGQRLSDVLAKGSFNELETRLLAKHGNTNATHACAACLHGWAEPSHN